jgi:hypothetical protein
MKQLLLFFFLFFSLKDIQCQAPYGNEWIDPTKPHYKIGLTQSKLYRISYTTFRILHPI